MPLTPTTVFDEWQSYQRAVVPPDAPMVQSEECRRAFYAGAWAMYWLIMNAVGNADEEACEVELIALESETRAIITDLRIPNAVLVRKAGR
jgi:hypothetical protein